MKFNLLLLLICFQLPVFSQSNSINEKPSSEIVQQHIEPFNNRDLDKFSNAFDINVLVSRFPNDTMYLGRDKLKEDYARFYKEKKKTHVKVLNRMTHKNFVIDEELGTVNNSTNRQVTIYTTSKEGITSMTFLSNANTTSNPEVIIDKQLEVYNNRDIDAFATTYSNDIKLYSYPFNLLSEGQEAIQKQYGSFFKQTPDLNAQIMNRIVLGNKVIDKEKVTANGNTFYAIAIYEVNDEKISKVTFIQ